MAEVDAHVASQLALLAVRASARTLARTLARFCVCVARGACAPLRACAPPLPRRSARIGHVRAMMRAARRRARAHARRITLHTRAVSRTPRFPPHTRPLTHCFGSSLSAPPCTGGHHPRRGRLPGARGRHVAGPLRRHAHTAQYVLRTHASCFLCIPLTFPSFFVFCFLRASGIFLVLDRAYVLPLPGVRPLWEAGLACLRTHLATHPALTAKAVRGLLGAIERERGGEGAAARPLLKSLLRLLAALVRRATARTLLAHIHAHAPPHSALMIPRFPAFFLLFFSRALRRAFTATRSSARSWRRPRLFTRLSRR
jgi:hypothetical protein